MNIHVKKIISEIDWEIKMRRLYLLKEHKKGRFDFQTFLNDFKPYHVNNILLQPLIEQKLTEINKNFEHSDTITNPKNIKYMLHPEKNTHNFLEHGVLFCSVFITPENEFYYTQYYRNLSPQTFMAKLNSPTSSKEQETWQEILQKVSYGMIETYADEKDLVILCYHLNSGASEIMKRYNPQNFKRSTNRLTLPMEDINPALTWKEIRTLLNILIQKLDDTCMNILNRADVVNFIVRHADEIKQLLPNITQEEKEDFKHFYEQQKDWFYLLPQAIDLTQNRYYSKIVNPEHTREVATTLHDIIQFMALQITMNDKKNVIKKIKI